MSMDSIIIQPGPRRGSVTLPASKSHLHRLLIASFLAQGEAGLANLESCSDDTDATLRCLKALANEEEPVLDCGESGSTLRFLLPLSMQLCRKAVFLASGRLPQRPLAPLLCPLLSHGVKCSSQSFPLELSGSLQPGVYEITGDVSSQIISGLLFALPLLNHDSKICCTTPLQSSGYVDMTCRALQNFGIFVHSNGDSFSIPGGQKYRPQGHIAPELDWSAAAFWLGMNALGSQIAMPGLSSSSCQPDSAFSTLLQQTGKSIDVSQAPDLFPALAVFAAASERTTVFTGVKRLRFKESDRLLAMQKMLTSLGARMDIADAYCEISGTGRPFNGSQEIQSFNDHRIAMAAAMAATVSNGPLAILNPGCVSKSYPAFFEQLQKLDFSRPARR